MSLAMEKKLDHLHWPLILCTIVICSLGVWNLASATKNALNPMWLAQSKWMLLGVVAVGAFLFLDYRFLSTAAWPLYFAALALLASVAFRGKKVLGARRWLQLGPMQLQPSEFVKLALIVLVALVMKQPDLGTALVTFFIAMTMIVFAKVRWQSLTALFAGGIAGAVFAWERLLKPYQKSRIVTFLDPQAYAKGAGYHAIQSVIAVGSGQWSGKGWGEGTQNQLSFLPEQHTDFIFSVWAEEHGFLGGVLLLSLYGFLVLTALDVAANARDKFGSFLAIGIAALL